MEMTQVFPKEPVQIIFVEIPLVALVMEMFGMVGKCGIYFMCCAMNEWEIVGDCYDKPWNQSSNGMDYYGFIYPLVI